MGDKVDLSLHAVDLGDLLRDLRGMTMFERIVGEDIVVNGDEMGRLAQLLARPAHTRFGIDEDGGIGVNVRDQRQEPQQRRRGIASRSGSQRRATKGITVILDKAVDCLIKMLRVFVGAVVGFVCFLIETVIGREIDHFDFLGEELFGQAHGCLVR